MAATNGISVQSLSLMATVLFMMFGGMGTAFELQISGIYKDLQDAATFQKQQREDLTGRINYQRESVEDVKGLLRNDITVTLLPRKEFEEFQRRFAVLDGEVTRLQLEARAEGLRQAHDPVEAATLKAIDDDFNKRIDLIQTQIVDVNRQIAAALIIIDNNNGIPIKHQPTPP